MVLPKHAGFSPEQLPPTPGRQAICAAPLCRRAAGHRHHIIARGFTRGDPQNWVIIADELFLNLADLCPTCHDLLESQWGGCPSRLRWMGGAEWGWWDRQKPWDVRHSGSIVWYDPKGDSWWEFRGFLKGGVDYWMPWKNTVTTS